MNKYILKYFDKEVDIDVQSNTFLDKYNTEHTILRSNTNSNVCNNTGDRR